MVCTQPIRSPLPWSHSFWSRSAFSLPSSATLTDAALSLERALSLCTCNFFKNRIGTRLVFPLLKVTTILACHSPGQTDHNPPHVREGSLLYRSPISGLYESVPLVH